MKKILILTIIFSSVFNQSNASHLLGGQISWKCLTTGKYIFYLEVYQECNTQMQPYVNTTLDITGFPLPGINSIVMKPDSQRFMNRNNGILTNPCHSSSLAISCQDPGAIRQLFYKSDSISLLGIPPASGWNFIWNSNSRSTSVNLRTFSTVMLLKSTMFSNQSNDSIDTCYDSSPVFKDSPPTLFCRTAETNLNMSGYDDDLDSLVYSWESPLEPPIFFPQAVQFDFSYSFLNPLPDSAINSANKKAVLNSETGNINFQTVNGSGLLQYSMANKISSYREGKKIAEITREFVIYITDCPNLISSSPNTEPSLIVPLTQDLNQVYRDTVFAGDLVQFSLGLFDFDTTGFGNNRQTLTLHPLGTSFSNDFLDSSNCNGNLKSCAVVSPSPTIDSDGNYTISDTSGLLTAQFSWQTVCDSSTLNNRPQTHFFVLNYQDDHCPTPLPMKSNRPNLSSNL